jgi:prolyl-tRNA synthetase
MKLKHALDTSFVTLATDEKVTEATGAPVGFAGPVGLKIPVYADWSVRDITGGVTGANEADAHLVNVVPGRDFSPRYADLRNAVEGDGCPRCRGTLTIKRGIEVGHVFKLGTKYSEAMGATFLDEQGKERPMIMGCYGIGIGRTAAASIEQNHDENGIIWPVPLAPFGCEVVPVNVRQEGTMRAAEALYETLNGLGVETLLDDRDERAGVKFKDADLIGIPVRVTVGERNLKQGLVEIKRRNEKDARLVKVEAAAAEVKGMLEG